MKSALRCLLCVALCWFTVGRVISPRQLFAAHNEKAEKKPSGTKVNAKSALASARKALGAMIKSARADKGLDPKTPKNKPYWKSLHLVAQGLNRAQKGLTAKNDDFFKGVADARQAEEQMKVDWQLTDSKNRQVIEDGKKLGHALAILRTDFSKEADRKKKGGDLTAKEKAQFEKIKGEQRQLLAKIKKLEKEAKKDKALEKGLRELQKQANHILKEPATVDAYIATLYLLDVEIGLVRGYEFYVDKDWRTDWIALETIETSYEAAYSEWETSVTYDWATTETSVDVDQGEEVDVDEAISDDDINSEESYAENDSFDMSEAEEEEVAAEEDTDEEASDEEDSMEDESDDEGEDMSDDEGGSDEDGGDMDDDGGDEGE